MIGPVCPLFSLSNPVDCVGQRDCGLGRARPTICPFSAIPECLFPPYKGGGNRDTLLASVRQSSNMYWDTWETGRLTQVVLHILGYPSAMCGVWHSSVPSKPLTGRPW